MVKTRSIVHLAGLFSIRCDAFTKLSKLNEILRTGILLQKKIMRLTFVEVTVQET